MTSIVEVIRHYQRSINSNQDNEARLLHCINKLYKLPIKVEHLQETGIGKTVNSLRKFNGEIGVAAKSLVTKWKAMVAAEEEPIESTSQPNGNEDYNNDAGGTTPHEEDEDENRNHNSNRHRNEDNIRCSEDTNSKPKETHKSRSSSSCTESSIRHSTTKLEEKASKHSHVRQKISPPKEKPHNQSRKSEEKERDKSKSKHKSSGDHYKNRDCEKERERHEKKREEKPKTNKEQKEGSPIGAPVHKSKGHSSGSKSKDNARHGNDSSSASKDKNRHGKHNSSSKDKDKSSPKKMNTEHKSSPTSTSKSSTKYPERAENKRPHSDCESTDFKPPPAKVAKTHKFSSSTPGSIIESSPPTTPTEEEGADGGFDSSMGANFNDILGMLNVPVKKSKKSSKSPSTPSSSSSKTSRKDSTTQSKGSISASKTAANKANETKTALTSKSSHSTPSTSKAVNMKPDLLAPTTKLEPLDPSIALELPTISTNYRPMPLNQTVMDCVFNNNSSSSTKAVRALSDAEALTHGISSKTIRTKVYSGVRTGQIYQVPSLFDMCIRILQKNIDALEYTGGVPFEVLKAVLERATPQQLYIFEEYNPYLMEDSDVLWQQHVARNYRAKKRQENESWREMFIRCQEEDERRLSVLKDSIKASQKIAAAPIRKTQLAFVDSMVKPPRNILKRQEQFGTKAKLVATPAARVASLSNVTPNAAKTGDQRLKVPSTVRDYAQVSSSSIRPKKAPLMQKTLQFIRGRHKR